MAFHSSLLAFAWSSRKAESFSDDRTVKICGKIYEKVRRLVYDCAYVSVLQPHVPLSLSPKRFQCFSHLGDEDYSAMVLIMETPFGKDDLMAMLDSVEDAVVKLDGSAKYVAMNKAAADIFRRLGQDPQAMIGKSMWEVFPDLKGTLAERELDLALKDHVPIKFKFFYPGDQHWYDIQGYPSHPGVILVFRDITGRKSASQS